MELLPYLLILLLSHKRTDSMTDVGTKGNDLTCDMVSAIDDFVEP